MNLYTGVKGPPFNQEMSPHWWKHMYSVLSALTWRPMSPAARSRLYSRDSHWACISQKRYVISVNLVRNCFCGISSDSFLYQIETVVFLFINRRFNYVVQRDYQQVWGKLVSLQHSCCNVEVVCVSIRWADFYFRVLYSIIMAATVSLRRL